MLALVTLVAHNKSDLKKLHPHFARGFVSVEHDLDFWHKPNGRCSLERSIRNYLHNSWNTSKVMCTHGTELTGKSLLHVWLDLSNCKWRCISCNSPLYWNRSVCHSCTAQRVWDGKKHKVQRMPISRHLQVLEGDYEMVYRSVKMLNKKEKVLVSHLDCRRRQECKHVSAALRRRGLRGLYTFSSGNITMVSHKF